MRIARDEIENRAWTTNGVMRRSLSLACVQNEACLHENWHVPSEGV